MPVIAAQRDREFKRDAKAAYKHDWREVIRCILCVRVHACSKPLPQLKNEDPEFHAASVIQHSATTERIMLSPRFSPVLPIGATVTDMWAKLRAMLSSDCICLAISCPFISVQAALRKKQHGAQL